MPCLVRQQAPAWSADAVVDEDFKTITSESLKGKYYVLGECARVCRGGGFL